MSPCLSGKGCLFDPKNPDSPRNCDQAVALQTRHFKIEIVPSELRVASHQGVEVTIRGSSEKFEDAFSDGFWWSHQASFLLAMARISEWSWPMIIQEVLTKSRAAPRY